MQPSRLVRALGISVTALVGAALAVPAAAAPPAGLGACPLFPADSFWHADVRSLPVHPKSGAWLTSMGGSAQRLHPDFGDSGEAQPYGIPYKVVDPSRATTSIAFDYADESDRVPYPFGPDIPVEGGSDRHALMLDRDSCVLSELFDADWNGGSPTAGSGAVFDLRSNRLRPSGWTSADAAGLAIFPGLLRRDEVLDGRIDHPIRMTAQRTDRSFVWPARHQAGSSRDANLPPMGAWFRLRADYPTAGLQPATQVILEAFKAHGLILADNGSNWFFTGAADAGWEPKVLDELKAVQAGSFEAVDASGLMVDPDSGAVRGGASTPAPAPATTAAPAPATTAVSAPAPTTTAAPRSTAPAPATTAAPTAPSAPSTSTTDPSAIPALPTTAAPDSGRADLRMTRSARQDSSAVMLSAAAALVAAAAIAVLAVLLRRRRRRPDPT